jgi:hypothetical protein
LAIIPECAVPDAVMSAIASGVSRAIVAPCQSSTPAVAPAMINRPARSAAARWPASVSAFTFSSDPDAVMPILATTGM